MKCQPTHTSGWLTHRIQESVLFTISVYYKGYNLGRDLSGKVWWDGGLELHNLTRTLLYSSTQKLPKSCCLWVLCEVPLHSLD